MRDLPVPGQAGSSAPFCRMQGKKKIKKLNKKNPGRAAQERQRWGTIIGASGKGDKNEERRAGGIRKLRAASRRAADAAHPTGFTRVSPAPLGTVNVPPRWRARVYVAEGEFLVWDASSSTETNKHQVQGLPTHDLPTHTQPRPR